MFVLHNPFKTNVQEKFKIFKYSYHMMLLNWKQFIGRGRTHEFIWETSITGNVLFQFL